MSVSPFEKQQQSSESSRPRPRKSDLIDLFSDIPEYPGEDSSTERRYNLKSTDEEQEDIRNKEFSNDHIDIEDDSDYDDDDDEDVIDFDGKVIEQEPIKRNSANTHNRSDKLDNVAIDLSHLEPIKQSTKIPGFSTDFEYESDQTDESINELFDIDLERLLGVSTFEIDEKYLPVPRSKETNGQTRDNHTTQSLLLDEKYTGIRFDIAVESKFVPPHYVIIEKIQESDQNSRNVPKLRVYRHSAPVFIPIEKLEDLYLNTNLILFIQKLRQYLVSFAIRQHLFAGARLTESSGAIDRSTQEYPHIIDIFSNSGYTHLTIMFEPEEIEYKTKSAKQRFQTRPSNTLLSRRRIQRGQDNENSNDSEEFVSQKKYMSQSLKIIVSSKTNRVQFAKLRWPQVGTDKLSQQAIGLQNGPTRRRKDLQFSAALSSGKINVKNLFPMVEKWWNQTRG